MTEPTHTASRMSPPHLEVTACMSDNCLLLFLQVCNSLAESAKKDNVMQTPDSMFSYLIERVRNNLHVVLCMSPVGELFR